MLWQLWQGICPGKWHMEKKNLLLYSATIQLRKHWLSESCKESEQYVHICTLCSQGTRKASSSDIKEPLKTIRTKDLRWLELFTQLQFPLHLGAPPMYAFAVFLEVHTATSKQYKTAISPEKARRKKSIRNHLRICIANALAANFTHQS